MTDSSPMAARLARAWELQRSYAAQFGRLRPPKPARYAVTHYCLELGLEYQGAISAASGDGRHGAAHTLLRALIETTFRALWLVYIADDATLENFVKGRLKPDLNDLIKWIRNRKKSYPQLAHFASACERKAAIFNSYAHAGIEQLARRHGGFDERERIAALNFADTFLVIDGEIAAVVHDDPPVAAAHADPRCGPVRRGLVHSRAGRRATGRRAAAGPSFPAASPAGSKEPLAPAG